jgi:hypothetical protein
MKQKDQRYLILPLIPEFFSKRQMSLGFASTYRRLFTVLIHTSASFFETKHLPIIGESRISNPLAASNRCWFVFYSTHRRHLVSARVEKRKGGRVAVIGDTSRKFRFVKKGSGMFVCILKNDG